LKIDVRVPSKRISIKKKRGKNIFADILKVTDEKNRIRWSKVWIEEPDPYQNVTDLEH
jgi:hypothetical protein